MFSKYGCTSDASKSQNRGVLGGLFGPKTSVSETGLLATLTALMDLLLHFIHDQRYENLEIWAVVKLEASGTL